MHIYKRVSKKAFLVYFLVLIFIGLSLIVVQKFSASTSNSLDVRSLTNQLESLNSQYTNNRYGSIVSNRLASNLKAVANKRKIKMLELAKSDPDTFLANSMPSGQRNKLSNQVKDYIEEEVTMPGNVSLVHGDNLQEKISKDERILTSSDAKNYLLTFNKATEEQTIIQKLSNINQVSGYKLENNIIVNNIDFSSNSLEAQLVRPESRNNVKLAVILVTFADNTSAPSSYDLEKTLFFNGQRSTANYFKESSGGKVNISGINNSNVDIFGWYQLPVNITTCTNTSNVYDYKKAAKDMAKAAGVDLSGYTNLIYLSPYFGLGSGCGWWSGLAFMHQYPSEIWLNGTTDFHTVTHELGHSFDLGHSNLYRCHDVNNNKVAISSTCGTQVYGDELDIMGQIGERQLQAYDRLAAGWLSENNVTTVTTSGTYTIRPIKNESNNIQVLRIPRDKTSDGIIISYYYLEYRQSSGYFDNFASGDPYTQGVTVHLANPYSESNWGNIQYTNMSQPLLIDNEPNDSIYDSSLKLNRTMIDPNWGVTIKTTAISSDGATVEVTLDPNACKRTTPSVKFDPLTSASLKAGQTTSYKITINNNNPASCAKEAYNMQYSKSFSGWQLMQKFNVSFSQTTFSLEPGKSIDIYLSVTSPTDTALGNYPILIDIHSILETNYYDVVYVPVILSYLIDKPNPTYNSDLSSLNLSYVSIPVENSKLKTTTSVLTPVIKGTIESKIDFIEYFIDGKRVAFNNFYGTNDFLIKHTINQYLQLDLTSFSYHQVTVKVYKTTGVSIKSFDIGSKLPIN